MPTIISSRTPEGYPAHCPLCQAELRLEFSPAGDATCPRCGCLVWQAQELLTWLQDWYVREMDGRPEDVGVDKTFRQLGMDSLEDVELVMALEEEFDLQIPDTASEQIQSVRDLVRYLSDHPELRKPSPPRD